MNQCVTLPAAPRTIQEVRFFVDESPCERCGQRGLTDEEPRYREGAYRGMCASCRQWRTFLFEPLPARPSAPPFELSGEATPSALFDAAQLRAIVDRELARVPRQPAGLATLAELDDGRVHLVKARIALSELAKFDPADGAVAAELAQALALWDAYVAAQDVVDAKPGAHPPPRGLGDRFADHRQWLARGRRGDGQLVFRFEHWRGQGMAAERVHGALIEDTTFERVDFSFSELDGAVIRRARFLGCNLSMARLDGARLEQVDMTGSVLSLASLRGTVVIGGDWRRIAAGRSTWRCHVTGVDLRGAGLRDTVLDGAVFERCDLREADFSRRDVILDKLGTARGARLLECDLRGARVEGWRLDGTEFERCRLHGLEGAPELEGDVKVVAGDLSVDGDGSVVGSPWPRRR